MTMEILSTTYSSTRVVDEVIKVSNLIRGLCPCILSHFGTGADRNFVSSFASLAGSFGLAYPFGSGRLVVTNDRGMLRS